MRTTSSPMRLATGAMRRSNRSPSPRRTTLGEDAGSRPFVSVENVLTPTTPCHSPSPTRCAGRLSFRCSPAVTVPLDGEGMFDPVLLALPVDEDLPVPELLQPPGGRFGVPARG